MTDMPPDWAIGEACKRSGFAYYLDTIKSCPTSLLSRTVLAFARMIAKHEQPPVDPLQECLRETYGAAAPEFVAAFRAALEKRGLTIAKAGERA